MVDKYIAQVSGSLTEITATVTSAGAGNAGDIIALDAAGKLDESLLPTGIGADTQTAVASEALSAGDLVNIWDDSSTPKVRKADATSAGKEAHGFVLAGFSSSATATIYFEGSNTGVSGLTGGKQYLSTIAGASTVTPPSATGNVVQVVGFSTAATIMNFRSGTPIILA